MGVWNCPDCDYKNSDSSKTCASCGASRPGAYRVNASATTWKCPKCNTSNSTNVSKCFRCGASRYGDTVRTQHEEPEERKGFQVNSKVAAVCIAVAVVVAVGSAINRASTSRPSVQSSTTSVTTEATTKQEKKNSASKPSSSSKPSVLIKYAADENNISAWFGACFFGLGIKNSSLTFSGGYGKIYLLWVCILHILLPVRCSSAGRGFFILVMIYAANIHRQHRGYYCYPNNHLKNLSCL